MAKAAAEKDDIAAVPGHRQEQPRITPEDDPYRPDHADGEGGELPCRQPLPYQEDGIDAGDRGNEGEDDAGIEGGGEAEGEEHAPEEDHQAETDQGGAVLRRAERLLEGKIVDRANSKRHGG